MFNSLPSGVALYYFMFNIFGIAQQLYVTKFAQKPTLESMKVDPKKQKSGGIMARLQEMEQQQRQTRQQQMGGGNSNKPQNKKKK
jgi:membrane protein insertase Oxa1/YidC/SpoIIIJ